MLFIDRKSLPKLVKRSLILITYLFLVIFYPNQLIHLLNTPLFSFKLYQLVWLAIVFISLKTLFFAPKKEISSGKAFLRYYNPDRSLFLNKNRHLLKELTRESNQKAMYAATLWLIIVTLFLLFYFLFHLNDLWAYGFVIFAYLLDSIAITLWCPFRNWIIKNKCCNSCRIYNWGYWMIFIVLIALPSFWNYSLIFLSILILIRWEYYHYKYPERFYEISNLNLRCNNCQHSTGFCKIK